MLRARYCVEACRFKLVRTNDDRPTKGSCRPQGDVRDCPLPGWLITCECPDLRRATFRISDEMKGTTETFNALHAVPLTDI